MCDNVCDLPNSSEAPSLMCVRTLLESSNKVQLGTGVPLLCNRGPCTAANVPLQQIAVLHNVRSAAGDDASYHHEQNEKLTLKAGLRRAADISNADACSLRDPCEATHTHTHGDEGQHPYMKHIVHSQRI